MTLRVFQKWSFHLEDAVQVDVDEADLALHSDDGAHGIRARPVEVVAVLLTVNKLHEVIWSVSS